MPTLNKLEYLDETKGQIKNVLNTKFNSQIQDSDTFRSYVGKINDIYDNWTKVTGEGSEITLNNTRNGKLSLKLNPSELIQKTTTGKNILDPSKFHSSTNMPTIDNETSIIDIITNSSFGPYTIFDNLGLPAGDYTIYCEILSGTYTGGYLDFYDLNNTKYSNGFNFLTSSTHVYNLSASQGLNQLKLYSPKCDTDVKLKIWLVSGTYTSETIGDYEPYTNGASPNPSYPQQIHTISGDNEIVVCNKNLFDKDSAEDGKEIQSGIIVNSPTWCVSDYIPVEYNKSYVKNITNGNGAIIYDKNYNVIDNSTRFNNNNVITINNTNAKYLRVNLPLANKDTYQIEVGSTATSYIEHKEQVKEINLGNLEYCEIGDYKDEFYLATDSDTGLVSGKWYLKKNIGKVVLDGTENWATRSGRTTYAYALSDVFDGNATRGLCNYWKFIASGAGSTQSVECMASANTNKSLNIFTNNSSLDTVANLKTWLSTHNTIVCYVLSTPTYTLLNDTLQEQINDIYNTMKSYNGQTNISQVNNDLGFNINAAALLKGGN